MYCSTISGIGPTLARLPRGLALLLILSLMVQAILSRRPVSHPCCPVCPSPCQGGTNFLALGRVSDGRSLVSTSGPS